MDWMLAASSALVVGTVFAVMLFTASWLDQLIVGKKWMPETWWIGGFGIGILVVLVFVERLGA